MTANGLRPRPDVPAELRDAIREAVERSIAADRHDEPTKGGWRFSGRWFTAHPIRTRSRPG